MDLHHIAVIVLTVVSRIKEIEKKIDGPDSFIIYGSQTTPEGIIEGKTS